MNLAPQTAESDNSTTLFRPISLPGLLHRRLNLHLGTVTAFVVVNLFLIAACLLVLRQNLSLRTQVAGDVALLTPRNGSLAPPLAGTDWTGTQQSIVYGQDQRPTLVYTFTKECPFCQRNWRALRSLQSLAPRSLRFTYIDTIGDKFDSEYLAANGIGHSDLLVELSPASKYPYEALLMPQVVLVDHNGKVQWAHVGELAPNDISKVLSLVTPHSS